MIIGGCRRTWDAIYHRVNIGAGFRQFHNESAQSFSAPKYVARPAVRFADTTDAAQRESAARGFHMITLVFGADFAHMPETRRVSTVADIFFFNQSLTIYFCRHHTGSNYLTAETKVASYPQQSLKGLQVPHTGRVAPNSTRVARASEHDVPRQRRIALSPITTAALRALQSARSQYGQASLRRAITGQSTACPTRTDAAAQSVRPSLAPECQPA